MDEDELAAIEQRCNAVPSDPFIIEDKSPYDGYECPLCEGEGEVGFARYDGPSQFAAGWEAYGVGDDLDAMEQFTKHAHADILMLIGEVRRLQGEVKKWQDEVAYSERALRRELSLVYEDLADARKEGERW